MTTIFESTDKVFNLQFIITVDENYYFYIITKKRFHFKKMQMRISESELSVLEKCGDDELLIIKRARELIDYHKDTAQVYGITL